MLMSAWVRPSIIDSYGLRYKVSDFQISDISYRIKSFFAKYQIGYGPPGG